MKKIIIFLVISVKLYSIEFISNNTIFPIIDQKLYLAGDYNSRLGIESGKLENIEENSFWLEPAEIYTFRKDGLIELENAYWFNYKIYHIGDSEPPYWDRITGDVISIGDAFKSNRYLMLSIDELLFLLSSNTTTSYSSVGEKIFYDSYSFELFTTDQNSSYLIDVNSDLIQYNEYLQGKWTIDDNHKNNFYMKNAFGFLDSIHHFDAEIKSIQFSNYDEIMLVTDRLIKAQYEIYKESSSPVVTSIKNDQNLKLRIFPVSKNRILILQYYLGGENYTSAITFTFMNREE